VCQSDPYGVLSHSSQTGGAGGRYPERIVKGMEHDHRPQRSPAVPPRRRRWRRASRALLACLLVLAAARATAPTPPADAPGEGQPSVAETVVVAIASGADDAEEFLAPSLHRPELWPAGYTFVDSGDLELGFDPTHGPQLVGLRFVDVEVPPGATIERATVTFTADGASDGPLTLRVFGQRSGSAEAFVGSPDGSGTRDLSTRPGTETVMTWTITERWSSGARYATPDLGPIVQEIVDGGDWQEGAALVVFFETTGEETYRRAFSFEGARGDAERVARLQVEYSAPADEVELAPSPRDPVEPALPEPEAEVEEPDLPEPEVVEPAPEPVAPEPVAPEPELVEPVAPEPEEPVAPEPVAPEPEVVEPTPEPTVPGPQPIGDHRFELTPGPGSSVTGILILRSAAGTSSIEIELDDALAESARFRIRSGTCEAPGAVLTELLELGAGGRSASADVGVAGSALRLGGFIVEGAVARTGAPLTCTPLAP
jgi:hypothetical protein